MIRNGRFRAALVLAPALLFLWAHTAPAQRFDPIQWSFALEPSVAAPGSHVTGRVMARMDSGWHLYSLTTPRPPIATTLQIASGAPVRSYSIYQPQPVRKLDPNFGVETETFANNAVFLMDIEIAPDAAPGQVELTAQARFQACDDTQCLPPRQATAIAVLTIDSNAQTAQLIIPAGYSEVKPPPVSTAVAGPAVPVPAQTTARFPTQDLTFLLIAFGFGLAAIFTPCVFPMIPITVSFFLNKPVPSRRHSLADAFVFSLGIIVLFTSLGLIATAALGASGMLQLGSNIWVNGFIALVFLVFGLSLLGAFEITIPSGILTRLDRASKGGGFAGTLLMGLTFSLAAFACVGPFLGTLLAASIQQGGIRPALGMLSFAGGLALPFLFLALFPSYLRRLPKSGGWLERVKVVMGLVILAAMFKYLSSVDQVLQWNILTRERFLAAWIVLFALAGLYLLGLLRLPGIKPDEPIGLPRLLFGAAFLIFAISLIPGMFGARLGELDAYVPAPSASSLFGESRGVQQWMKDDYEGALARARSEGKLVLVSFTGFACTNCHWMKANMFTRPEVATAIKEFVLVELYVDGMNTASERHQQLQKQKFGTVAIPFYAILTADEKVLATHAGLTRETGNFLAFLNSLAIR